MSPKSLKISIHAPLAGCDQLALYRHFDHEISIHAPLAGCDDHGGEGNGAVEEFQSTHPLRGATIGEIEKMQGAYISIHAPLAGCDCASGDRITSGNIFQSTHPLRGATAAIFVDDHHVKISIHAPLAGCDKRALRTVHLLHHFNPRTPCGVRHIVTHL